MGNNHRPVDLPPTIAAAPNPATAPTPAHAAAGDGVLVTFAVPGSVMVVGHDHMLPVPRSLSPRPIVGDLVVVTVAGDRVAAVLSRRNVFRRADPAGGEQLLPANVDVVAIVCGLDRPVKAGRVQRAVALAWDCGATPVVVLTKSDVVPDASVVQTEVLMANPGVEVLVLSAATHEGIEPLQRRLQGLSVVLLGESGSGKSTLTNALLGRDAAHVAAVRSSDHKGRHTTTDRHLFELPAGGWLIDTPGIRAVGLPSNFALSDEQFADILELSIDCRFRDCTHTGEPQCAVQAAVADGALASVRLEQWLRLTAEIAGAERRSDEHTRREYDRKRTKEIYKPTMAMKYRNRE